MSVIRPIPQWFRLKTDTKIQVRKIPCFKYNVDLQLYSTVQRQAPSLEKDQAQHLEGFISYRLSIWLCQAMEGWWREGGAIFSKSNRRWEIHRFTCTHTLHPRPCTTYGTPTWFILKLRAFLFMEDALLTTPVGTLGRVRGYFVLLSAYLSFFWLTIGRGTDICSRTNYLNYAQCLIGAWGYISRVFWWVCFIFPHIIACVNGSKCEYPFLLSFCDEISLCTRPSSLSFCDEKYPGCPFYAWTPWLLFLFTVSSCKHADSLTQVPNIRNSSERFELHNRPARTTCRETAVRW